MYNVSQMRTSWIHKNYNLYFQQTAYFNFPSSQKATALAAATLRESTP